MRKIPVFATLSLCLFVFACKNVDEKLVQQMEQTVADTKANTEAPKNNAGQSLADMKTRLAEAAKQPGNEAAYYLSDKIQSKYDALVSLLATYEADVKKLQDDYTAGVIDKATAESKLAELSRVMGSLHHSFDKLNNMAQRPTGELISLGNEMMQAEGVSGGAVSNGSQTDGGAIVPAGTTPAPQSSTGTTAGATPDAGTDGGTVAQPRSQPAQGQQAQPKTKATPAESGTLNGAPKKQ